MGKVKPPPITELRINLFDPRLSTLMRAGLGGLAAAAPAVTSSIDDVGSIAVEPQAVVLNWHRSGSAKAFFERLFTACFSVDKKTGLLRFPGVHDTEPLPEVLASLNEALRMTFCQPAKKGGCNGGAKTITFEIDDRPHPLEYQTFESISHQRQWEDIAVALTKTGAETPVLTLKSWALPGAAERHVGLGSASNFDYTPTEVICACFAPIGSIQLRSQPGSAVVVVPKITDLKKFSPFRPRMTPMSIAECYMANADDAVMTTQARIYANGLQGIADGVDGFEAFVMRPSITDKKQKYRTHIIECQVSSQKSLSTFHKIMSLCPAKIRHSEKGSEDPGWIRGYPSPLRGFVAANLSREWPWYRGFATATSPDRKRIHRFHEYDQNTKKENDGALYPPDKETLTAMTKTLNTDEQLLISSIHTAILQRRGRISEECKALGDQARYNRFDKEHERLRLAFSGSRTREQIRHALADLWSRAGIIPELQGDGWSKVQKFLLPDTWEAARDLALIALASYQGKGSDDTSSSTSNS